MDNLMDRLTYNLKRIRRDRKIPYSVLERSTGIRASRLQEAEEGELQLSVDELDRLLAFYQLKPEQVLQYRRISFVKIAAPVLAVAVIAMIIFSQTFGQPDDREPIAVADDADGGSDAGVVGDGTRQGDGASVESEAGVVGDGTGQGQEAVAGPDADAARGASGEEVSGGQTGADGDPDSDASGGQDAAADPSQDGSAPVGDKQGSGNGLDGGSAGGTDVSDPADGESGGSSDTGSASDEHESYGSGSDEESGGEAPAPAEEEIDYGSVYPGEEVDLAPLPVPVYEEPVVFRIWGNITYDADELPKLEDNDLPQVKHIIPVESLSNDRPGWLDDTAKDRFILSLANADVWSDTAVEEWLRLRDDGYPAFGIGRAADAYKPYIVQVKDQKVGFLSLAGLIHEAHQIAHPYWIGLPRAYDDVEIIRAVEQAKREVDYLFVLIHVGNKRGGEVPIAKQERLTRVAAEAGADLVIGNRSLRAQAITAVGDVPVFYSLGRSISDEAQDDLTNYVLDIHYTDGVDKIVAHVGSMEGGVLRFGGRSNDAAGIEAKFGPIREVSGIKLEIDDRTDGGRGN